MVAKVIVSLITCLPLAAPAPALASAAFGRVTREKVVAALGVAGSREDSEWRVRDEMFVRAVTTVDDCPS
jgi:hypothetical protein